MDQSNQDNEVHGAAESWVRELEAIFQSVYPERRVRLTNLGVVENEVQPKLGPLVKVGVAWEPPGPRQPLGFDGLAVFRPDTRDEARLRIEEEMYRREREQLRELRERAVDHEQGRVRRLEIGH